MQTKFHVVGGGSDYSRLFKDYGFKEVDWKFADLMIFTGGHDVDPSLYNEKALRGTCFSTDRDAYELDKYYTGIKEGKKAIGICRGAQLLHVLNDGKLWQDVDQHALGGKTHVSIDLPTGDYVENSSCHHQMMRVEDITDPKNKFKVICITERSTKRSCYESTSTLTKGSEAAAYRDDIEVLWYPNVETLCYQGHPEYRKPECTLYFTRLLHRFGFLSTDTAEMFYRRHYGKTVDPMEGEFYDMSWIKKMFPDSEIDVKGQ